MIKKIGNYDFVESGSAIVYEQEPIIIGVGDLQITLNFINDRSTYSPYMDVTPPSVKASGGGKELVLDYTNVEFKSGYANVIPFPVGVINSRRLYLKFAVQTLGINSLIKLFTYNFLLGESV